MLENNIAGIQVKGWRPYTPVMVKLLSCHPNLNIQDNDGNTLLMFAAIDGDSWLARRLLSDGVRTDVKNKAGQTAATLATANGYSDIAAMINNAKGGAGATR
jgi:ankyrin repeat protein